MGLKAAFVFSFFLSASALTVGEFLPATGLWAVDGGCPDAEDLRRSDRGRLPGVDGPESGECLAGAAMELVRGLITGPVWLELDPEEGLERRDRNGRLLVHLFLSPERTPGASLAVILVREGLAKLDIRDPKVEVLSPQEKGFLAEGTRVGLRFHRRSIHLLRE